MKNKTYLTGVLLASINTISLGLLGIIDKLGSSQNINPFIFSAQSVTFGLLFTAFFAIFFLNKHLTNELKKTSFYSWKMIFFVGIFASGFFVFFRFLGLIESTGTFATLSQIITTAITALLAKIFLDEWLSKEFWIMFVLIIISMYFVSVGKLSFSPIQRGDMYLLIGTLFLASANIFAKKAVSQANPVILSVGRFFFGSVFLIILSATVLNQGPNLLTFSLWSVASGLFWTVNNVAFNFAIQKIGVMLTTSILMTAPALTMTLEFLILKHSFNQLQFVAAFTAIVGGILMIIFQKKALSRRGSYTN